MKRNKKWRKCCKQTDMQLKTLYKKKELSQSWIDEAATLFIPCYCADNPAVYSIARFAHKHKTRNRGV